jgi:primosomal protein N' (replication factor Y)
MPASAHVLGPLPVSTALRSYDSESADAVRALIRVSRADGAALASALHEAQGVRSARKALPVRVRIDPLDLG